MPVIIMDKIDEKTSGRSQHRAERTTLPNIMRESVITLSDSFIWYQGAWSYRASAN